MNDKQFEDGETNEYLDEEGGRHQLSEVHDVFGNEQNHQIKYKTLSWQMVAALMIAEIVSNGMLSLPSSGGVVGVSQVFWLDMRRWLKHLYS
jgi:hypothetical protein